jgi:hypothetical protein
LKSRNILMCALVTAAVAAYPSPCFADVVPGGGLADPTSTPVLLCGLAFVALVSGVSFVLLRRMSRRRVAATAGVVPGAGAQSAPTASTAEEELAAMRKQLAAEEAAAAASAAGANGEAPREG